MPAQLTSKRHQVPDSEAVEYCFQRGWSDGLPVIPPTADRVETMLAAARRPADAPRVDEGASPVFGRIAGHGDESGDDGRCENRHRRGGCAVATGEQ